MNEPLYCFHFDMETGKVTRYTVTDYKVREHTYIKDRREYCFNGYLGGVQKYYYNIRADKLDSYAYGKVFSFDPDVKKALDIIVKTLQEKALKLEEDYKKYNALLEKAKQITAESCEVVDG